MDPSIMKLLEEDEDETMHSGADVEAFTAALNRDIEGDTSSSLPSDSSTVMSRGNLHSSSQLYSQWQTSAQDEAINTQDEHLKNIQQPQEPSPQIEPKQEAAENNQQQQIDISQELNRLPMHQKISQEDHKEHHNTQIPVQFSQPSGVQMPEKNSVQSAVSMPQKPQGDSQHWQEQSSIQLSQAKGMQISERNTALAREAERTYNPNTESQHPNLQQTNKQLTVPPRQVNNPTVPGKQVPFALLLPVILPQLDKERAAQLTNLYNKLKKNEIAKEAFVRAMKGIVGDQMLKLAVLKLHEQPGHNQFQLQSQLSAQKHPFKLASSSSQQFIDPHSLAQHQKGQSSPAEPSRLPTSAVQSQTSSSYINAENTALTREMERRSESPVMPAPFSSYGTGGPNYHPYSGTNVNASASSLRPQSQDLQGRQVPLGPTQLGGSTPGLNLMNPRQNSFNDPKRVQVGSLPNLANGSVLNSVHRQPITGLEQNNAALSPMAYVKQEPAEHNYEQHQKSHHSASQGSSSFSSVKVQIEPEHKDESSDKQLTSSASTPMLPSNPVSSSVTIQADHNANTRTTSTTALAGVNAKTPPKKPAAGQKKPLEALGSSPPLQNKKQKVSGTFSDQSIEQLNDVTAVSGVNLREEEEQLFSGPKEDSRVSDVSRRFVQEEEDKLMLQRIPLQKKLAQIMAKCGVMNISNDVERCLSLCVEERLRGFISNLIRLSKQRADIEKASHKTFITSDVRQRILSINQEARAELERKQAESDKLRKLHDPDDTIAVDGDREKDDVRAKSLKSNKEDDDKMRATAANVAARAAVGGDDMLSKWQLMAEQARQKREGGDTTPGSHTGKDVSSRHLLTTGRNGRDNYEAERRGQFPAVSASGAVKKIGRNQPIVHQTRVSCNISVKDVIAALEREPQMSKSSLTYRLYERVRADAAAE